MHEILSTLIKNQEKKIFKIGRHILFTKKAKCPRCGTKVFSNHASKHYKICFFCNDCQLLFEKK